MLLHLCVCKPHLQISLVSSLKCFFEESEGLFTFPVMHFAVLTTGANAKVRYQITSGNKGGVFDIEPEVGTIFIAQPLDYEQQKRYKLLVLASDGKWEDYAAVVVTVVNKNDEAPVFSMNEYYGSVTEELDGSPVFVLQVRD